MGVFLEFGVFQCEHDRRFIIFRKELRGIFSGSFYLIHAFRFLFRRFFHVGGKKKFRSIGNRMKCTVCEERFRGSRPRKKCFKNGTFLPFSQSGKGVAQCRQFRFGIHSVCEITRNDTAVQQLSGIRICRVKCRFQLRNIQIFAPRFHAGRWVSHEFFDTIHILLDDGLKCGFCFAVLLVLLVGCGSQGSDEQKESASPCSGFGVEHSILREKLNCTTSLPRGVLKAQETPTL